MIYKNAFIGFYQILVFLFTYDMKIILPAIFTAFFFCVKQGTNDCSPVNGLPVKADICKFSSSLFSQYLLQGYESTSFTGGKILMNMY